jgi:hypothetical protein
MIALEAGQAAILAGDPGSGFIAYLLRLSHPDGVVRMSTMSRDWTDGAGDVWTGGAAVLSIGSSGSMGGLAGGAYSVTWSGAVSGLVALARDGRTAGSAFEAARGFFTAGGAAIGAPLVDFRGICEQPEISADPDAPKITLTVRSRLVRLGRERPVRMTPADSARWFGGGAVRDTGFDLIAGMQNADPFADD